MKARLLAEENRKWWTLAAVSVRPLHDHARQHGRERRAARRSSGTSGSAVSQLEWVVTGYALSFAVLMLTGGKLADMFGRRRIFLVGLAIFTLSSLFCGLAGSAELLIGGARRSRASGRRS